MLPRLVLAAALAGGLLSSVSAQEPARPPAQDAPSEAPQPRSIRNAPSPRAVEFAAYIYAAVNVCGYTLGTTEFEALLAKQNARPEDVSPRGPFGNRVMGIFTLMSNQMNLNREQSCLAVAGEYGPEGSVARNVLLPPGTKPVEAKTP
ncbi:hypothetical protein [Methylobacterium sp. Leaf118]|uniref:hypothetical protein n=1 Tax=Methylobacterium sp. Leaf118 TaxID=2876562 RepID=UPI001E56EA1F|nr:hypothetical protein [Methylobacterium sp. Leaf118]